MIKKYTWTIYFENVKNLDLNILWLSPIKISIGIVFPGKFSLIVLSCLKKWESKLSVDVEKSAKLYDMILCCFIHVVVCKIVKTMCVAVDKTFFFRSALITLIFFLLPALSFCYTISSNKMCFLAVCFGLVALYNA